jgi:hypothetical protein
MCGPGFLDQEKLNEVRKYLRDEVARDIATLAYWSGFLLASRSRSRHGKLMLWRTRSSPSPVVRKAARAVQSF